MYSLLILFISIIACFLGSLLGIGGGIILVPVLVLFFGINIRFAIAASLISIIATSSGAAASYLKDQLTNLRLAVLLELGTVLGAMSGFLIASRIENQALFLIFGLFLFFSAIMMFRQKFEHRAEQSHPWAKKLRLHDKYQDNSGVWLPYHVANVPFGLFSMYFAGILSALLGIGSGIFKVLAMDGAMKIPIKVSTATSNFMIGVTAAASAGAFFLRGDIKPEIACPVAVGIVMGSWAGARVMPKLPALFIKKIFLVVLVITSLQMVWKGLHHE